MSVCLEAVRLRDLPAPLRYAQPRAARSLNKNSSDYNIGFVLNAPGTRMGGRGGGYMDRTDNEKHARGCSSSSEASWLSGAWKTLLDTVRRVGNIRILSYVYATHGRSYGTSCV